MSSADRRHRHRRRRRLARVAVGTLVALVVTTSPLWAVHLGRRIAWFEIDRVEISGTRLLAPHEVLAASGIVEGQSLLDERAVWERALRSHPVIADARITRVPPNTIRLRIDEKRPVALVEDDGLRLATSSGEILPLDPALVSVDLPIVHGALGGSLNAGDGVRRILAEIERLTEADPLLMAQISELRALAADTAAFVLVHPAAEIVMPFGASAARTAELREVLNDIRRRTSMADPEARPRLDLRFEEQIVAAPSSSREIS